MVAVASSIPTGSNIFSKFIFPEIIYLTDLVSDFLSDLTVVKTWSSSNVPDKMMTRKANFVRRTISVLASENNMTFRKW